MPLPACGTGAGTVGGEVTVLLLALVVSKSLELTS